MKQAIKIVCVFAIIFASVLSMVSGNYGLMSVAAAPVVLDTQKIVFLTQLKEDYKAIDTWLNEAEDLSSFVIDGQTLRFPEAGADPAVYKNRTTDIDSVEPTETINDVSLDVYDSQNYKLRNINLHALPFDKVQYYTKKSANSIVKQEIEDAAHAFTPTEAGAKKVFVASTGAARDGLKMLTLDDIILLARKCDAEEFPDEGRNLVLPSDMWWDLVNNNTILKGQLERAPLNGIIKPTIVDYYGFKIHKSTQKLGLGFDTSTNKKAIQGTAIAGDVVPCGFGFLKESVFKAGGQFFMFRKPLSQNTDGRAEEFGFQHRFKADFQRGAQKYSAMIHLAKNV